MTAMIFVVVGIIFLMMFILLTLIILYFILNRDKQPSEKPTDTMPMYQPPPSETVTEDNDTVKYDDAPSTVTIIDNEYEEDDNEGSVGTATLLEQPLLRFTARLIVIEGQKLVAKEIINLDKQKMTVGRNTGGIVNDIGIQDKSVSRNHAKFIFNDNEFFINDTGSTFGTSVDGIEITKYQNIILQDGAEITFGPNIKFRFEAPDMEEDKDKTVFDILPPNNKAPNIDDETSYD